MLLPFLAGLTAVLLMLALIGGRRRDHGKPTAADSRKVGRKHMTGEKKEKGGKGRRKVDTEAAAEADIAKLEKTVAFLSGVEKARKGDLAVETQRLEQSRKVMEEACSILEENVQYLSGREQELLARIRSIEDEVDSLRRKRVAEMESVIASQKEAALNKVSAWTAEEQSRLAEQLNLEYANRMAELRQVISDKIHEEFDQIHVFFEDFAKSRKKHVEKDIKDFLDLRRSAIIDDLK